MQDNLTLGVILALQNVNKFIKTYREGTLES